MTAVGLAAGISLLAAKGYAHYPGQTEELLLARTTNANAKIRSDAATLLFQYQNDKSMSRLLELTKDPDWRVRYAAVKSLGKWADPRAKDKILPLAADPMPYVRMIAVWGLAQIGDPNTIPTVIEATKDSSKDVRNCAQLALRNMTETKQNRDYNSWKIWWEKNKDKSLKAAK